MPNLTVDPQPQDNTPSSLRSLGLDPQRGSNPLKTVFTGILIFVLLSVTAYGAYWYGQNVSTMKAIPSTSLSIPSENSQPKNSFPNLNNQTTPAAMEETVGWKTYTNVKNGFSFKYPENYSLSPVQGFSDSDLYNKSPQILMGFAKFENKEKSSLFKLMIDLSPFSADYLKNYAPTGSESILPIRQTISAKTFYYYGPGGGGVRYPDLYFLNLNNRTLIFSFDGPYENDKTPTLEAKNIQRQILSTFKFL